MAFTQTITVRVDDGAALASLLEDWHRDQHGTAPGYRAARVLEDRDAPGRYVVQVDFASQDEAERNNDRPETRAWAEKLQGLAGGQPEYRNYTVAFATR